MPSWKQRLRWEEGAVVRQHCRKHLDMADPTNKAFCWENFFVSFELILVNLIFEAFVSAHRRDWQALI